MRYRHPRPASPETHTWEHKPSYRTMNGGLGSCNTSSGKRLICVLGGIGCDVDHVSIAQMSIHETASPGGEECPYCGSAITPAQRDRVSQREHCTCPGGWGHVVAHDCPKHNPRPRHTVSIPPQVSS